LGSRLESPHPALMGTAVLCDEAVYAAGAGADFTGGACSAYAGGDADPERIDGPSGRLVGGGRSSLCRAALRASYESLCRARGLAVDAGATYADAKRAAAAPDRAAAAARLRDGPRAPFRDWLDSAAVR